MIGGLVIALVLPVQPARALPKLAEKGLFAAGLIAFGGVVRWLIARDMNRTADATRRLRREWGEPVQTVRFVDGFDTVRIDTYRRGETRAIAVYRNEELAHVRYERTEPLGGVVDRDSAARPVDRAGGGVRR